MARVEEIDLLTIVKELWNSKLKIAKVVGVFMFIGVIIAVVSPIEYKSSSLLLPETHSSTQTSLGSLGGLAGLAGIDLGSMQESAGLPSNLYPELVYRTPFILEILRDTIQSSEYGQVDLRNYMLKYYNDSFFYTFLNYTVGLPGTIKQMMTKDTGDNHIKSDFYNLTSQENDIIQDLQSRISVDIEAENGLLQVSCTFPEAYLSAQITNNVVELLKAEIIKYKSQKVSDELAFIKKTYDEARDDYSSMQDYYARFVDENLNINSEVYKVELKQIQNEYNLKYELYKGLATNFEQVKIKLNNQKPVFTTLEPIKIPDERTKPKRKIIVILWMVVGLIVASAQQIAIRFIKRKE